MDGRVAVNGRVVTQLGTCIDPEKDRVAFDGRPVSTQRHLYFFLNKPRDMLCTCEDPAGRRTFKSLLPDSAQGTRLYPVGRLDRNSEGLLLVTNDGRVAQALTHPRHHIEKTYRVWIADPLHETEARTLVSGIRSEGDLLRAVRVQPADTEGPGFCYEVVLAEGRNRQVRRMFEALGRRVRRLQRTAIGPFRLRGLRLGQCRVLSPAEQRELRTLAGLNDGGAS